jgi:hypothetical protein
MVIPFSFRPMASGLSERRRLLNSVFLVSHFGCSSTISFALDTEGFTPFSSDSERNLRGLVTKIPAVERRFQGGGKGSQSDQWG